MVVRFLFLAVVLVILPGPCLGQALDVRVLGSSSQGGFLIKQAEFGTLQLSDVLRVERDGQTLGEAWVTAVRVDGMVVVVPQFPGQMRSTDRVYFVRHVQVVGSVVGRGAGGVTINLPVDAREVAMAEKGSARVAKEFGPLSRDPVLIARVERIGRRIAATCPRSSLTWTFHVVESRQVNAFTVGMGRIYVTRGLLELVDDEELAGALSHEIAHVCLRHSTRIHDTIDVGMMYVRKARECEEDANRIASEPTFSPEMRAMRVASKMAEARAWAAQAASVSTRLDNWKTGDGWDNEYEADHMGLIYAQNAGFRPQGLVDCLQKLAANDRKEFFAGSTIEGASTHPPLSRRIEIARKVCSSIRPTGK